MDSKEKASSFPNTKNSSVDEQTDNIQKTKESDLNKISNQDKNAAGNNGKEANTNDKEKDKKANPNDKEKDNKANTNDKEKDKKVDKDKEKDKKDDKDKGKDKKDDKDKEKDKKDDTKDKEKNKLPKDIAGVSLAIIIYVIIALDMIFAILQLSYYIYACVEISSEGNNFTTFSIDVFFFTNIRKKRGHSEDSTYSFLLGFIITAIVIHAIYIIVHCVLIFGVIKKIFLICVIWCGVVGFCILVRIIIIICAPLSMFQFMGLEMIFELVGIGFVLLFALGIREDSGNKNKVKPKDSEGKPGSDKDKASEEKKKKEAKDTDKKSNPKDAKDPKTPTSKTPKEGNSKNLKEVKPTTLNKESPKNPIDKNPEAVKEENATNLKDKIG